MIREQLKPLRFNLKQNLFYFEAWRAKNMKGILILDDEVILKKVGY